MHSIVGLPSWYDEARVRRAVFLAKLTNSPTSSWQHVALLWHIQRQSDWFTSALADLQLVLPGIRPLIGFDVQRGTPFAYSNGYWSSVDSWISCQAYCLPLDLLGRRSRQFPPSTRDNPVEHAVRTHLRSISMQLQRHIARQEQHHRFWRLQVIKNEQPPSKAALVAELSCRPGLPLHHCKVQ